LLFRFGMVPSVLLADDEPSVSEALSPLLELAGMHVQAVATPEEAERALAERAYDLLIADLSFTGQRGVEGLALIERAKRAFPALRAVLFTAHGSPDLLAEALRRGADDAWSKALPIEELVARARRLGLGSRTDH
jgi:DNA-binding NtrC family response regulator